MPTKGEKRKGRIRWEKGKKKENKKGGGETSKHVKNEFRVLKPEHIAFEKYFEKFSVLNLKS